jgi:hypothetical protein
VAIAGRLKAGKSTLVNALIGRRVAPTEVGECTKIVTHFRYGTADRLTVQRRQAPPLNLPLDPSGMIPGSLGIPRSQIAHLEVALTNNALHDLTVIDTPGLASANSSISAGAERFLFTAGEEAGDDSELDADSAEALAGAEAIIYVFTHSARSDDVAALEAFRATTARWSANPINSIGLLNKVDTITVGRDPWPTASSAAQRQAEALRRHVADVVPVVGLLAETTAAGLLTATDCEALRRLAQLSATERRLLVASTDLFLQRDCEISRDQRERLLSLLDLYGISFSLAHLAAEPHLGAPELVARLHAASGFPRVRSTIEAALRHRADAIKAGWALTQLQVIADRAPHPAQRDALRSAVEQLLRQPEYHQLRLIEVAQQTALGTVELPESWGHEVHRLALGGDPAWILGLEGANYQQLTETAMGAAARWRAFAVSGASPPQARVADVVHRGYFLLAQRLRAESAPAPIPPHAQHYPYPYPGYS